MESYVTGACIKALREKKNLTQKQLAELLCVSDKAISKWETGRGLPDVTLLEPLARALNVSLTELLAGQAVTNRNRGGSLPRMKFYVCPVCGNVITALGTGVFSCCGVTLPPLEPEPMDAAHQPTVVQADGDWFVTFHHPMTKEHYLSFVAYVTYDKVFLEKLYPEQNPEVRIPMFGKGKLFVFCNREGLMGGEGTNLQSPAGDSSF